MTESESSSKELPCGYLIYWVASSSERIVTVWGRLSDGNDRWVLRAEKGHVYATKEEAEAVAVVLAAKFPKKIGEIRIVPMTK